MSSPSDFDFFDDMTPGERREYLNNLRERYQERQELNKILADFQEDNGLDNPILSFAGLVRTRN